MLTSRVLRVVRTTPERITTQSQRQKRFYVAPKNKNMENARKWVEKNIQSRMGFFFNMGKDVNPDRDYRVKPKDILPSQHAELLPEKSKYDLIADKTKPIRRAHERLEAGLDAVPLLPVNDDARVDIKNAYFHMQSVDEWPEYYPENTFSRMGYTAIEDNPHDDYGSIVSDEDYELNKAINMPQDIQQGGIGDMELAINQYKNVKQNFAVPPPPSMPERWQLYDKVWEVHKLRYLLQRREEKRCVLPGSEHQWMDDYCYGDKIPEYTYKMKPVHNIIEDAALGTERGEAPQALRTPELEAVASYARRKSTKEAEE